MDFAAWRGAGRGGRGSAELREFAEHLRDRFPVEGLPLPEQSQLFLVIFAIVDPNRLLDGGDRLIVFSNAGEGDSKGLQAEIVLPLRVCNGEFRQLDRPGPVLKRGIGMRGERPREPSRKSTLVFLVLRPSLEILEALFRLPPHAFRTPRQGKFLLAPEIILALYGFVGPLESRIILSQFPASPGKVDLRQPAIATPPLFVQDSAITSTPAIIRTTPTASQDEVATYCY